MGNWVREEAGKEEEKAEGEADDAATGGAEMAKHIRRGHERGGEAQEI